MLFARSPRVLIALLMVSSLVIAACDKSAGSVSRDLGADLLPCAEVFPCPLTPPLAKEIGGYYTTALALGDEWLFLGDASNSSDNGPGGKVDVLRHQGGSWALVQTLQPADLDWDAFFGGALAAEGDRLVVGAPEDDEVGRESGAAFIFVLREGRWERAVKLAPETGIAQGGFGFGVAVVSGHVIVSSRDGLWVYIPVGDQWVLSEQIQSGVGLTYLTGDGKWLAATPPGQVAGAPTLRLFEVAEGRAEPADEFTLEAPGYPAVLAGPHLLVAQGTLGHVLSFSLKGERWVAGESLQLPPGSSATGRVSALSLRSERLFVGLSPGVYEYRFAAGRWQLIAALEPEPDYELWGDPLTQGESWLYLGARKSDEAYGGLIFELD